MGLAATVTEMDRGAKLKEDWARIATIVERLDQGASWMEFYLHLHGRYRVAARYMADMSLEARQRYGMQLQVEGMRGIKMDMIEGAIECIVGTYLESWARSSPDFQDVHALSRRLIHSAIALYGDETDIDEAAA
jgi:hypothetical protein